MLTTRQPKKRDGGEYAYVTAASFDDLERRGILAAVTRVPSRSEDRRYGYRAEDIDGIGKRGKVPVAITDATLLECFIRRYGRRFVLSIGLLPPGTSHARRLAHLRARMLHRGRENPEQIKERLRNAGADLRLLAGRPDLFDFILVSGEENLLWDELFVRFASLHG